MHVLYKPDLKQEWFRIVVFLLFIQGLCCSCLLAPDCMVVCVHVGPRGYSRDQEAIDAYGTPSGAQILAPLDIARAVVYAVSQPSHVAVNEV